MAKASKESKQLDELRHRHAAGDPFALDCAVVFCAKRGCQYPTWVTHGIEERAKKRLKAEQQRLEEAGAYRPVEIEIERWSKALGQAGLGRCPLLTNHRTVSWRASIL